MVLIVQNNLGNLKSTTTKICPVTSRKSKSKMTTHVHITTKDCDIPQDSIISCEQERCISKRRLIRDDSGVVQKVAVCPPNILQMVDVALMKSNGTIGLHVSMEDAIEALDILNGKTKTFEYGKSYNNGSEIIWT